MAHISRLFKRKLTFSMYQHRPNPFSIKQRPQSVDLSLKSLFWKSKQLFAVDFLLATCNVCPLANPEFSAHNTGIRLLANHSFNATRQPKSGVIKKHCCCKISSDEIIVQVLPSSYLFGKYFLSILSCKGTHSCFSHKLIRKFPHYGTVHSYMETKKQTKI